MLVGPDVMETLASEGSGPVPDSLHPTTPAAAAARATVAERSARGGFAASGVRRGTRAHRRGTPADPESGRGWPLTRSVPLSSRSATPFLAPCR